MFRIVFIASYLIALSSAVTSIANHTRHHSFKGYSPLKPNKNSILLGVSQNDTFNDPAPPVFLEKRNDRVIVNITDKDLFACPQGYTYLSNFDALNDFACSVNSTGQNGTSRAYRTQGGGSVSPQGESCARLTTDRNLLNWTACVNTTVLNATKIDGRECPLGYDLLNLEELYKDPLRYCHLLDEWDIANVGLASSFSGTGYECALKEFDEGDFGHSICVHRAMNDIKVVPTDEEICGKNRSLLTIQEILADKENYCQLVPYWGIARLAGGASFGGQGYDCQIKEIDRGTLGHVVCGKIKRQQLESIPLGPTELEINVTQVVNQIGSPTGQRDEAIIISPAETESSETTEVQITDEAATPTEPQITNEATSSVEIETTNEAENLAETEETTEAVANF